MLEPIFDGQARRFHEQYDKLRVEKEKRENPASTAQPFKILVIVGQLWFLLTFYKAIVPVAFFATFVITVLLFRLALLDRN